MHTIPLAENSQQTRQPKHSDMLNRIQENASGYSIDDFREAFCQKESAIPKRIYSLCELIREGTVEVRKINNEIVIRSSNLAIDETMIRRPIIFQILSREHPNSLE